MYSEMFSGSRSGAFGFVIVLLFVICVIFAPVDRPV